MLSSGFYMYIIAFVHIPAHEDTYPAHNKIFKQKQYGGFKENNYFCLAGDNNRDRIQSWRRKKELINCLVWRIRIL